VEYGRGRSQKWGKIGPRITTDDELEVAYALSIGAKISARITNKVMGGPENMASDSEPEKNFWGGPPKGSPEIAKNRHYCCRQ